MLFIRRGPRCVFVRTDRVEELSEKIRKDLGGKESSFEEGLTESREFNTLLFLTPVGPTKTRVEDARRILFIPQDSSFVLSGLFKPAYQSLIHSLQLGPGLILLRILGNGEGVRRELENRYGAQGMGVAEAISEGEEADTIILLSRSSLNKVVSIDDFINEPLLIRRPLHELYWNLRGQAVRIITSSMESSQWYEMRINIYDAADHYEEHYERLVTTLADLDVGMILGESWTKDHALALMSVLAYQVRLFSLEEPKKMKRILMGLEYDPKGRRFVDMDLYYRNRKINKNDKGVRDPKTDSYHSLRKELRARLSESALSYLDKLEISL
ncbi:MAG TPA: hypothetical protein ENN41_02770 [Sediminispirochaeta sp.]|nr:hypothetical protein [Sediminispirochaeta sp.]